MAIKLSRKFALRVGLAALTLATLVYVGWRYTDELHRLKDVSLPAVCGILGLYCIARWGSADVMRAALASLGHVVGATEIYLLTFVNSYANLIVPRAGLGMPAVYLKMRRGVPIADVSAVQLVAMTLLQTTCIGVLGVICLLLVSHVFARPVPPATYGVFSLAAICTLGLLTLPIRVPDRAAGKIAGFLRKLVESWRRLGRDGVVVGRIIALQTGVLLCRAARVQLCFHAIGQPVGFLPALAASLLADVGSLVSITPSGLGFREAAIVLSTGVLGASQDVSLAAALLDRLVTTGAVIAIGQIGMWQIIRPAQRRASPPAPLAE